MQLPEFGMTLHFAVPAETLKWRKRLQPHTQPDCIRCPLGPSAAKPRADTRFALGILLVKLNYEGSKGG